MPTEIILPVLGETMDKGTVVRWFVEVGQQVTKGEPLYEVETDKAVLEVQAPATGVLAEILCGPGSQIPVLTVVGRIVAPGEVLAAGAAAATAPVAGLSPVAHPPAAPKPGAQPATGRVFASPRARKLATDSGIALEQVTGTGPGGRIVESDVRAHLQTRAEALAPRAVPTPVARRLAAEAGIELNGVPGTGPGGRVARADVEAIVSSSSESVGRQSPATTPISEDLPLIGVRRVIAERMAASTQTTAHVTLTTEADATEFARWRALLKEQLEPSLGFAVSYTDLLVVVAARALREFPYMNARLSDDKIQQLREINVGVAVDTERGLLVPVLRLADGQRVASVARNLRDLVSRARSGKSLPDDLSAGTFTITNLGMYEIDAFTPIINLPECAILGVGRMHPKPVVVDAQVAIRHMMALSLTFDHRLVDGAPAARFLQRIKHLIEQPYLLLG